MTEDEAKTKWCPMFRVSNAGAGGSQYSSMSFETKTNRNFISNPQCLASGCMAWRWYPNWGDSPENPGACTELPPIEGFCGLAGRP